MWYEPRHGHRRTNAFPFFYIKKGVFISCALEYAVLKVFRESLDVGKMRGRFSLKRKRLINGMLAQKKW